MAKSYEPKPEFLLVDGYNIIFSWEKLKALAATSLESARVKLLEMLSDYQGFTGLNIIIVFDAHKVPGNTENVFYYDNIKIVYTKEAETADNYIERVTQSLSATHIVRVATSDSLEQIIILSKGAYRVSAGELEAHVKKAKEKQRKIYTEYRPVKNNPLIDNLDKNTAEMLKNMSLQKEGVSSDQKKPSNKLPKSKR